jgi:hypothetical protein
LPLTTKSFFGTREDVPKPNGGMIAATDRQWSLIMWTVLSLIYRHCCHARLMEMRKYHLATAG